MIKGSYLVIEHTEALHVIDVNSETGLFSKKSEDSALVNLNAASEIAEQLRLRDMGGIIVLILSLSKAENEENF